MNARNRLPHIAAAVALSLSLLACRGEDDPSAHADAQEEHLDEGAMTNRVAIPTSVRTNLGITFIEVERRRIEQTLRVPGRFEYLPTARTEYRTALPGRVELLVEQFERVEAGTPLYRIESPAWRSMQQSLAEATWQIERLKARLATIPPLLEAHAVHESSLHESVKIWEERIEQLEAAREAGGGKMEELANARATLANMQAAFGEVQEKDATLQAEEQLTRTELRAAESNLEYLLASAAAVVSVPPERLSTISKDAKPMWASIDAIDIVASEAGVVESFGVTDGSWADEQTPVLTMVQPERLRFRASGLQSDLGVLREGLEARIVPPTPTASGRAVPMQDTMSGTLRLGLAGDPDGRTLDLFMVPDAIRPWARPGVSAQLEIVTDASASAELAIPLAAVQRDGLTPVIFRRDPANPKEAIRIEADLGKDDGRWVELLSGIRDGDEIVLDGAFQLMLATSGSMQKGGHFHADGTFHDGED